jgi:hypothetical protein
MKILLFCLMLCGSLYPQQSISFSKISKPGRIISYKLPSMVRVTLDSTHIKGMLTSYTDSTITLRTGRKIKNKDTAFQNGLKRIWKDKSLSREQKKTKTYLFLCPDSVTIVFRKVHILRLNALDSKHGTAKLVPVEIVLIGAVISIAFTAPANEPPPIGVGYVVVGEASANFISWHILHRYINPHTWSLKK